MKSRVLAHAVGYTTLAFVALAGTAQALPGTNSVDSGDIIDGEVRRVDIAGSAVNSSKVADGTITGVDLLDGSVGVNDLAPNAVNTTKVLDNSLNGADVTNGSLTGADVAGSSLSGGHIANSTLTGLDVADGSLTGSDIAGSSLSGAHVANNSLGGADISEASLDYTAAGCKMGLVHSWARVKGSAAMPSLFTASGTHVDAVHTCTTTSDTAFVRRTATGVYEVIFSGDPAFLGVATPNQADGDNDNTIAVSKINASTFQVIVRDQSGSLDDGWFTMMTF